MRRREFIAGLGGAAAAWPVVGRAQQGERVRRIGLLTGLQKNDPEGQLQFSALLEGLQRIGWTEGRNLRIETRWGAGNAISMGKQSAELLALAPEVILAVGGVSMQVLFQSATSVPIVFVQVLDPVGAGYVASLARPGNNITGFTNFEYGIAGKWLEILKEIAPGVTRVAVLRDPAATSGTAQLAAIQAVAAQFRVDVTPVGVRNANDIERGVSALAQEPNGGLIATAGAATTVHRDLLFTLAAQHRLPAIYPYRHFVSGGGLVSYGPDVVEQFRLAAGYIDRILKGEKPSDLPVQTPTKYELVINLKTAKALGLAVAPTLLARAVEVIE